MLNEINKKVKKGNHLALYFTRTKILAMAKSLTEPEWGGRVRHRLR